MDYKVQRNRVMIKPVVNEAVSTGGIVYSHTGEEKTNEGIVVAVGPGRTTDEGVLIPVDVLVGDKIMYDVKSGIDVKVDGVKYVMIKEEDIFCVVSDE